MGGVVRFGQLLIELVMVVGFEWVGHISSGYILAYKAGVARFTIND